MKKIFAILISLLFVASVFGVASLSATDKATATPERVKVGQIITVTSTYNPCAFNETPPKCYDPTVKIYDPSMKNISFYPDMGLKHFKMHHHMLQNSLVQSKHLMASGHGHTEPIFQEQLYSALQVL